MKAILLHIDSKGEATVKASGTPSELTKQARAFSTPSKFPKGVEMVQVWSKSQGMIKTQSKAKLEAQSKADAAFKKAVAEDKKK